MADTLPLRQDRYLVIGDGADFAAVSTSGDWPGTTRLIIESAALVETSFTPTIATTTATWALTVAQVTALVGTKTSGVLRYRVTVSSGDQLRGEIAGFLSIKTKWDAARTVQTLGAVVVGPAGPGIASGVVDEDGALVLTLDNAETIAPVILPPYVRLAVDGDGDYETAALGTEYLLIADVDGDYVMREFI